MSMTDQKVIEAHTSTGVTLPMRAQQAAKSGNTYFGLLSRRNDGSRYFSPRGVDLKSAQFGPLSETTSVKVPDLDIDVPVLKDQNDKGKDRITAVHTFTGDDGEKWKFNFRATQVNPAVVNVSVSINRAGGFGQKTAESATALSDL